MSGEINPVPDSPFGISPNGKGLCAVILHSSMHSLEFYRYPHPKHSKEINQHSKHRKWDQAQGWWNVHELFGWSNRVWSNPNEYCQQSIKLWISVWSCPYWIPLSTWIWLHFSSTSLHEHFFKRPTLDGIVWSQRNQDRDISWLCFVTLHYTPETRRPSSCQLNTRSRILSFNRHLPWNTWWLFKCIKSFKNWQIYLP